MKSPITKPESALFFRGRSLRVSSAEVTQRCGLKEKLELTRVSKLQWFGYVKKRKEIEALLIVHN